MYVKNGLELTLLSRSKQDAAVVLSQNRIHKRNLIILGNASLYSGVFSHSQYNVTKIDFPRLFILDDAKTLYSSWMYPIFEGQQHFRRYELAKNSYHVWNTPAQNDIELMLALISSRNNEGIFNHKKYSWMPTANEMHKRLAYYTDLIEASAMSTKDAQFELMIDLFKTAYPDTKDINKLPVNKLDRMFAF